MDNGLSKMDKYQVFENIPHLPSMHVLKARWVYTRKTDGISGKVAAYKARWVAKGYSKGFTSMTSMLLLCTRAPSVSSSPLSTDLT
jgi:hypothetical protein